MKAKKNKLPVLVTAILMAITMTISVSATSHSTTSDKELTKTVDADDYYLQTKYHIGSWVPFDQGYTEATCGALSGVWTYAHAYIVNGTDEDTDDAEGYHMLGGVKSREAHAELSDHNKGTGDCYAKTGTHKDTLTVS